MTRERMVGLGPVTNVYITPLSPDLYKVETNSGGPVQYSGFDLLDYLSVVERSGPTVTVHDGHPNRTGMSMRGWAYSDFVGEVEAGFE